MNNSFKVKYLKYKNKYLTLQKGGEVFTVTIKYSKYDTTNKTNIGKIEFYDHFYKTGNKKFALLNGANKSFARNGRGTNEAITNLKGLAQSQCDFFDHSITELLFNSSNFLEYLKIKPIIDNELQQINYKGTNYPAGTVIKALCTEKTSIVSTVYHINGVDFRDVSDNKKEIEESIKPLIMEYYKQILLDFNENGKEQFIYMPPIPGYIFKGTEITDVALIETILDFIKNNKLKRSFTIILGLDPFVYEDKYKQLFINAHEKDVPVSPVKPVLTVEPGVKGIKYRCRKNN
jgi:hypothetical protein